jgi:hypothetical protein
MVCILAGKVAGTGWQEPEYAAMAFCHLLPLSAISMTLPAGRGYAALAIVNLIL